MRKIRTSKVIRSFGQFVVTTYGIETTYPAAYIIGKSRLGEPWWRRHMADKNWVNMASFNDALDFARTHFDITEEVR